MNIRMFLPSIIIFLTVLITYSFCNGTKIMDKYIKEKNSFSVAIEALRNGKTIYRAGQELKYLRREIIIDGTSSFQYGWRIDGREFHEDSHISLKDMLENDWIIQGN